MNLPLRIAVILSSLTLLGGYVIFIQKTTPQPGKLMDAYNESQAFGSSPDPFASPSDPFVSPSDPFARKEGTITTNQSFYHPFMPSSKSFSQPIISTRNLTPESSPAPSSLPLSIDLSIPPDFSLPPLKPSEKPPMFSTSKSGRVFEPRSPPKVLLNLIYPNQANTIQSISPSPLNPPPP
jgi:hypothetical protein